MDGEEASRYLISGTGWCTGRAPGWPGLHTETMSPKRRMKERKGRREAEREREREEFLLFSSYIPNTKPGDGEPILSTV